MRNIYKGPLRNLYISKLDIHDGAIVSLEYANPIVKKDLLFYKNILGSYISFEHGTVLPDWYEAKDFVLHQLYCRDYNIDDHIACSYINEKEISYSHTVSDEEFKCLKKKFREMRKKKK